VAYQGGDGPSTNMLLNLRPVLAVQLETLQEALVFIRSPPTQVQDFAIANVSLIKGIF